MAPLAPEMPTMMRWRGSDMGGGQRGLLRQGMGVQVGLDVLQHGSGLFGVKVLVVALFHAVFVQLVVACGGDGVALHRRPVLGFTANCTLEPPVSTPIFSRMASEATRMR